MAREESVSKVLVVDDSPEGRDIFSAALSERYNVTVACDGVEALELARREPKPDIILLDIVMPEMDGYEVCRQLKSEARTANIPIIFLTALSDEINEFTGLGLGAVDYIYKPVSIPVVQARLATHLELSITKEKFRKQLSLQKDLEHLRIQIDKIFQHDIKDLLTPVSYYAEQMKLDQELPEVQRNKLGVIHASANNIVDLIDYYRDIFQMESGCFQFVPAEISLKDIVERVVEEVEPGLTSKEIKIVISVDTDNDKIFVDERLTTYLFEELLKNLALVNSSGNSITVKISNENSMGVTQLHCDTVLPEEVVNSYFSKYNNVGADVKAHLGCYSAWLIADTMMGSASIVSNEEKGTLITVRLPAEFDVEKWINRQGHKVYAK